MSANQLALWYLVAAVSFILALKGLSGPHTARRGNLYGMVGMAIALLVTRALVYSHSKNVLPILGGMAIGATIGAIVARRVQMTQMPELVAAMHSLVGLAAVFIAVAVGLAAIVVLLAVGLRATVIRPLHRLAAEARRVAEGDFGHEVSLAGPREVTDLAVDVNTMRERILDELAATRQVNTVLQEHTEELERSNSELEQFAYVASHDLQEPLRMVASYTQLLSKRYKGKLDSDADEFIAFAVDGASRMQRLIQDLLAYSRAGTNGKALREISSESALEEGLASLRATIESSGERPIETICPISSLYFVSAVSRIYSLTRRPEAVQ